MLNMNEDTPAFSATIVVPAYNAQATIEECVKALQKQTYPGTQMIVVDDGSTDSTGSTVQNFSAIRYVYQSNAGPAAARNQGAGYAYTDYIIFTDADCSPSAEWVEKAMTHFKEKEDVAVVSGSYGIANHDVLLARCVWKEIRYRHENLMNEYPRAFGSYNFAIRREIFEKVGGFDESYRHASGEDNDLSYKIIKAGYKIYFDKNNTVDHVFPEKLFKYLSEQYRHGYWRSKLFFDHPEMNMGDDYTFWKDVAELPLSLVSIFAFAVSVFFKPLLPIGFLCVAVLALMQIYFGFVFTRSVFAAVYYSVVMFLRAYLRSIGFLAGLIHFTFVGGETPKQDAKPDSPA